MPGPSHLIDPAYWKVNLCTPNAYSYEQIPDLTGKVAIVTGANSGIGLATTVGLANRGARVIMACRSETRCKEAMVVIREQIQEERKARQQKKGDAPQGEIQLDFLEIDMNDLNKVQAAAKTFLSWGLPLHILINNSGIMGTPWTLSADGVEQQFAINYLGPFAFTLALLDRIKESQPARIVMVSSIGHLMAVPGSIDLDRINDPKHGNPSSLYGQSKIASLLFAQALNRRLGSECKVYVNSPHPGVVDTEMCRHSGDSWGAFMGWVMRTWAKNLALKPKEGALNTLYCATSEEIETKDLRAKFFIPIGREYRAAKITENVELQERLWAYSETLVKEKTLPSEVKNNNNPE
ncbi:hypothetical protein EMPS_04228 [Entomortierella parvispora]|uniref:NAD(P)-binding protein n=1 Tax=Entomortierella parvispora TaxID=205924 RepID=A0A9P3H839_9FUNG|nr:hypothetical protein EMPS_04228 [Entomortierella parvispora]